MERDIGKIRADVLDPNKGFHVLRSLYTLSEVTAYRNRCREFLQHGRVIHQRINSDTMHDYVHPRSHDRQDRTYRIYQFLHNHRNDLTGEFFSKAMSIRDKIEEPWNANSIYKAEKDRLQDYCIVTYYLDKVGMLPSHQDYVGPAPLPLIQFWVALSEPGVDYLEGNLVLYSKTGVRVRAETDLQLQVGDALLFDKSLYHEVEATEPGGKSALGRWTVLIGARAERVSSWQALIKGFCYDSRVQPTLSAFARTARAVTGKSFSPKGA